MTRAQAATQDILDDLFDKLEPLAKLRGYARDDLYEEARRIVEAKIDPWIIRADDDDDDC